MWGREQFPVQWGTPPETDKLTETTENNSFANFEGNVIYYKNFFQSFGYLFVRKWFMKCAGPVLRSD